MSFLVNFTDGKFSLASHITPSCWCEVKEADKYSSEAFICRFFRFDSTPKFSFESNIYLRHYKNADGSDYTNVHVGMKDNSDEHVYYVHFESFKPFCRSSVNNVEQAFVCFLNTIYLFDSAKEASAVIATKDIFDYSDPESLANHIEFLSKIVVKYGNNDSFFLKERIVDWLRNSMLKFGYSFVKLEQLNYYFPITFKLFYYLLFSAYII